MRGSTAGLEPDTMKGESATHYAFLSFLDSVFSAAVVTPAVVAFWRSVWELMGLYVYPNNSLYSAITSTIIGVLGHLMFALSQHAFEYFHPDKNRMVYYLVSRVYTVCFAFVCVNGWRGPWSLLDIYTQPNLTSVVVPTALGVVALASIRALRNVSAPPCAIVTDYVKGYFEVVTMFRVPVQRTSLYILDCLFSVLIVGTLVVFVWRGAWVLIDIYLFPEMADWSAWASLVLGYMSVAVAFLMQPAMRWLCDRINGAARLFAADVFLLFSLFGTLNVWRGIWNLLNIYFLPDNLELSCWITHWVSLILLILLGCSNSLLVRGVYIDAEEPAGKCVVFPCYYLRLIFQQAREKKNGSSSTVQLESMSKRKQEIDAKYADGNDVKQISINMESNHI
ncbi:PREDICTED: uncharacterized protein LOC108566416 isoform X2 [Nicrophorus vespilloides]|uniref:Uncharacterized protein LOC108566416 isoform X2 n=1 Tax=Nicrophorus vespilloides TaxID=110193 RepID=A0ABM1N4L3_NICVS|nr:PREDICTED: uncharacterized protein LOC108566416 isoform X2 [Nicrophorus vespilloides]